jgi:hypothetical protein
MTRLVGAVRIGPNPLSVSGRAKTKSPPGRTRRASAIGDGGYLVPQQTGVLFIITQQVQPAAMQAIMQSQHAWIILQQSASPLVQVIAQPSLVISHLHRPIVRLQQQTIIPFMTQQQLIIPPAIIWQRFCIIPQAAGSSQVQVIFIPLLIFSILIVQRGTIMKFGAVGIVPAGAGIPLVIPGIIIPVRSIIIAAVIFFPS